MTGEVTRTCREDRARGRREPLYQILEFRWRDRPWRDEILTEPLQVLDGDLVLPDGPGLGIDLDMDGVRKYLRREW